MLRQQGLLIWLLTIGILRDSVMTAFAEDTRAAAEKLPAKRLSLSLAQKINVLSGAILLMAAPLGTVLAFSGRLDDAVFVYKIFAFCYILWLFTSYKVYGVIADKGQKKYRRLELISRACAALFPLCCILLAYSVIPVMDSPANASFWSNLTIVFYMLSLALSIIIFSICQCLEVLFTLIDIKKKFNGR